MTTDAPPRLPWLDAPLARALAMPRAHALLLHGAAGAGSFELAALLATALLCEQPAGRAPGAVGVAQSDATAADGAAGIGPCHPCGRCVACRAAAARTHPDLHWLLPEELQWQLDAPASDDGEGGARKERKPSRQIRIDDVRAAIDWIGGTSSRGRAKVLLLHPAEALNPHAANALLKTLEEPPRGARIVLTAAEPERLLPTLRSRCQRVRLAPPLPHEAAAWLAAQGVAAPEVLLAAASGLPLDALALHAAGIDAARWQSLPRAALQGQPQAFAAWPLPRVLDALHKLCHDAMALAAGGGPRFFAADALPRGADFTALAAWSQELAEVAARVEHPWSEPLLLERLLIGARRALGGAEAGSARAATLRAHER